MSDTTRDRGRVHATAQAVAVIDWYMNAARMVLCTAPTRSTTEFDAATTLAGRLLAHARDRAATFLARFDDDAVTQVDALSVALAELPDVVGTVDADAIARMLETPSSLMASGWPGPAPAAAEEARVETVRVACSRLAALAQRAITAHRPDLALIVLDELRHVAAEHGRDPQPSPAPVVAYFASRIVQRFVDSCDEPHQAALRALHPARPA